MPHSPETIVLTGCTRGTGRALAETLIARGHRVLGCGRSAAAIAELRAAHPEHGFETLDITDRAAVNAWAEAALGSAGAPARIVNNAGAINRNAPLWKVPPEEIDMVLDVNVKGTINVIQAFLPAMLAEGRGTIVNFSSGWGRSTDPEVAPYCASKWAIEGLSQSLAEELPGGFCAVALNPGIIDTAMLRSCLPDLADDAVKPEDWAEAAADLILGLGPGDNGVPQTVHPRRSRSS
ncbi:MAG: SDR family oxidoreductase [Rhodovibrionaceae bacterium]